MAFETPTRARFVPTRYGDAEKEAILNNLDLELETRRKKIQTRLEENLSDFNARHKQLISNIPRVLRGITVEEFAVKYDASVTKFMELAARARVDDTAAVEGIEASVRKRKQPADSGDGPAKSSKAARKASASPTKAGAGGDATPRAVSKTFGALGRTPGAKAGGSALARARFASVSQPIAGPSRLPTSPSKKPPSAANFNPTLPAKTPSYPRAVRQEDTLLSANGSPLANPWTFDATRGTISLNSPPPSQQARKPLFSFRTRSGAMLRLAVEADMDDSGDEEPLAGLTDSAKKEVRDSVLALAQRYGALKV